ncbi:FadR/GntR family transcriptional regulator [Clavibacter capsici]|uniref:FadR/GntR family transcriptional regulator n=1 Tax=Clavibacter capsici TaxID=1874630 RepID=UPI0027BA2A5F|nr:FCD domain-containing protein [Clavibacter capsici]
MPERRVDHALSDRLPLRQRNPSEHLRASGLSPATAAQRTRIAELAVDLRGLGEAGALVDFLAADIEFHHLILEASGNDMFCALREVITEVLSGRTHQGLMPRTPRPHALDTHEQVAFAIRDGDAATAEAGMASLLAEASSATR